MVQGGNPDHRHTPGPEDLQPLHRIGYSMGPSTSRRGRGMPRWPPQQHCGTGNMTERKRIEASFTTARAMRLGGVHSDLAKRESRWDQPHAAEGQEPADESATRHEAIKVFRVEFRPPFQRVACPDSPFCKSGKFLTLLSVAHNADSPAAPLDQAMNLSGQPQVY